MPDITGPDWAELDVIRQVLIKSLRHRGVHRVEFVTSFSSPFVSTAWLITSTDNQRDALLQTPDLAGDVRRMLRESGREADLVDGLNVQSQETVERDYEGSWVYALR